MTRGGIHVTSGEISANSISFGAASDVFLGTTNNAYITKGSDGYLWVSYRSTTNVYAVRSSSPNSIASWDTPVSIMTGSANSNTQLAVLVPIGSGDIFAVGSKYASTVSSECFYTTYDHTNQTWAQAAINGTERFKAFVGYGSVFSAVSDGSGAVHMVFSSTIAPGRIRYQKYSSGAWDTPIDLKADANSLSLSLSINPATNDLFAYWNIANVISYKKGVSPYASENWGAETPLYSTGTNNYIISSYATSSTKAFAQWTNGASAPYSVMFSNSVAATLPCNYTSTQAGNWSDASTWVGGCVPGNGNNATIAHNVAMTGAVDIGSGNLTINNGATLTTNNNALTVNDMTINGTLTAGSSTITVAGNWDSSVGTYTYDTSIVIMTGASKNLTTTSSGAWYDVRFYNLQINSGASTSIQTGSPAIGFRVLHSIIVSGSLTVPTGKKLNITTNSTLTINEHGELAGAGAFYQGINNTSAYITNNGTISISSFYIYIQNGSTTAPITATTYGGALSIYNGSNPSENITGVIGPGVLTVNGSFSISSQLTDYSVTIDNTVNNTPITAVMLKIGETGGLNRYAYLKAGTGTITVNGDVTVYPSDTSGENRIDAGANQTWNISGNMTISDVFNASSSTLNVAGNWDSSTGSFNYGTSTVDMTGTSTVKASTSSINFYNLKVAHSSQTTTFITNALQIVNNLYTYSGGTLTSSVLYYLLKSDGDPIIDTGAVFTGSGLVYQPTTSISISGHNFNSMSVYYRPVLNNADITFTLTSNITSNGNGPGIIVYSGVDGYTSTLDNSVNNNSITCASIEIGNSTNTKYGVFKAGSANIDVNGTVTIDASNIPNKNKIEMGTSTWTVLGSWINNDTIVPGTSSITFDSTTTGKTITSGIGGFNNLTFAGAGGGWTLQDNLTATSLTVSAGNLIDNAKTVTVNGNISIANTAGLLTSTGTWIQGASGNISNPANGNIIRNLTIAGSGVTTTFTGNVFAGHSNNAANIGLTIGPGTVNGANSYFYFYNYSTTNPININNPTIGSALSKFIIFNYANVTLNALTLPDNFTIDVLLSPKQANITAGGNFSLGNSNVYIYNDAADTTQPTRYVDMANFSLTTTGGLFIGKGSNYNGWLKLGSGSNHSVETITRDGTGTGNILDFGSSTISVGGNIDFTGITVTPGTSTVNMIATTTGKTITSAGQSFNNLTFNGTGGGWTLQDTTSIGGNLSVSAGNLNLNSVTTTVSGNIDFTNGAITRGTSTLIMNGNAKTLIGNNQNLNSLQISGDTTAQASMINYYGTLTVDASKTLTISSGQLVNGRAGSTTTVNGTITGGYLSLYDNAGDNLSTGGTISSIVNFYHSSSDLKIPARTYGGAVYVDNLDSSNSHIATLGTGAGLGHRQSSSHVDCGIIYRTVNS